MTTGVEIYNLNKNINQKGCKQKTQGMCGDESETSRTYSKVDMNTLERPRGW
jgi:hypothetical protein